MAEMKPRTHFQILIDLCGMTHQETADYLGVSIASIRQWSRGNYDTPNDAFYAMHVLWRQVLRGDSPELPPRARETAVALETILRLDPHYVVEATNLLRARGRPRKKIEAAAPDVNRKPLAGNES